MYLIMHIKRRNQIKLMYRNHLFLSLTGFDKGKTMELSWHMKQSLQKKKNNNNSQNFVFLDRNDIFKNFLFTSFGGIAEERKKQWLQQKRWD